jgi:hypothetical protein
MPVYFQAVILSPFAVILSAAKNLALPLRVNYAKDLALLLWSSSTPITAWAVEAALRRHLAG